MVAAGLFGYRPYWDGEAPVQGLLGDEHILGGTLAGQCLVGYASERSLGRIVLALRRFNLRLRGLQLTPRTE